MELTIRAEWRDLAENSQYLDPGTSLRLIIAGTLAVVEFRGDVWSWEVLSDDWRAITIGSGWVDSKGEAIAAAENTIRKYAEEKGYK